MKYEACGKLVWQVGYFCGYSYIFGCVILQPFLFVQHGPTRPFCRVRCQVFTMVVFNVPCFNLRLFYIEQVFIWKFI
jgi:hypothetical protein